MSDGSLTNQAIAAMLRTIADLMEISGEEQRRALAYRRAAQTVAAYPEPVSQLATAGRLREIPGVGAAIAGQIEEMVSTGSSRLLSELQARLPVTILDLIRVPGIGPKTARILFAELGIADLDKLESAAGAAPGRFESCAPSCADR